MLAFFDARTRKGGNPPPGTWVRNANDYSYARMPKSSVEKRKYGRILSCYHQYPQQYCFVPVPRS